MFNSKKDPQSAAQGSTSTRADTTIIGSSSYFDGKLNASGILRVDGTVSGELNVTGNIIVGENGYIKGDVTAEKVTIAGKVEGNIHCSDTLELTSSGKLFGDIEIKNIVIEDGATFQGKCTMIQPAAEVQPDDETKLEVDGSLSL